MNAVVRQYFWQQLPIEIPLEGGVTVTIVKRAENEMQGILAEIEELKGFNADER